MHLLRTALFDRGRSRFAWFCCLLAMRMLDRTCLPAAWSARHAAAAVGRPAVRVDHFSSSAPSCGLLVLSLTRRWLTGHGGRRLIYSMADPVWRAAPS